LFNLRASSLSPGTHLLLPKPKTVIANGKQPNGGTEKTPMRRAHIP
jgi:hypothetical protein